MTNAPTVDYTSAPENYAELFRLYYHYVVNLVNKHGIHDSNKEDVASEILTRFMERGFLDKFDPSLVFEHDGKLKPARFKQFLSKFVLTYVMGHCDKQRRIQRREWQIIDMSIGGSVIGDGNGAVNGVWGKSDWGSVFGERSESHEDAVLDAIMEEELSAGLRRYLCTVPRRSATDLCDLPALFDAVRAQALATGFVDLKQLAAQFHVGLTAMHTWVWNLRAHIADHLGLPLPPRRPRATRTPAS